MHAFRDYVHRALLLRAFRDHVDRARDHRVLLLHAIRDHVRDDLHPVLVRAVLCLRLIYF